MNSLTASLCLAFAVLGGALAQEPSFRVKPFQIAIQDSEIEHARQLVSLTRLPNATEFTGSPESSYGIPLDYLVELRNDWLNTYDWRAEEAKLNTFRQYTVEIEGLNIHFVHEKSSANDAIPLVMFHGWPGSFHEYLPVVANLTKPEGNVSFDVVIPSLPGFTFSSAPPTNWTNADSARVFNTLMTEVLGYKQYMVFGSDWGVHPAWILYTTHPEQVRAAQVDFLPWRSPTPEDISEANITLNELEQVLFARAQDWTVNGSSYYQEQTHKPNTIGLALLDNPVGQLAWVGQSLRDWSDPSPSSPFTRTEALTSMALYIYTRTALSAAWIYSQNTFPPFPKAGSEPDPGTRAPLGFSAFQWNIGFWPAEFVRRVAPGLVFYNEHERGGHFPGLDNPEALAADLRELATYWKR